MNAMIFTPLELSDVVRLEMAVRIGLDSMFLTNMTVRRAAHALD